MKLNLLTIYFSIATLFFSACIRSNEFEKNVSLPNHNWDFAFKPSFIFNITDTHARYHMYLMMRHSDAYPYANIWLNLKTKQPNENSYNQMRVEVPLAQTDGKWLGRGMGEIWEHKLPLTGNGSIHYTKPGKYQIMLEQIMRKNPLPEVISIGIRLEKIN
jgi:gliding motility-associated lipoprotein GldH